MDIERIFREAYGQAVATLVRVFGDISLAEDAVQDAFVIAIDRWERDGIPPNPSGWIITTARNRAIDTVRRAARGRDLEKEARPTTPSLVEFTDPVQEGPVSDDRLRLIFTCCHPALRLENQVALTLRLLGGLTVAEIGRSFLVSEPAMAKRLVRAKYKIKAARIPYAIPKAADLPARLRSALLVIYLIYTAGLADAERSPLRTEAIRLARILVELMPNEPEAVGLLALLLLNEARSPTRLVDGNVVRLRDQDRSRWDEQMINEGQALVGACIRQGRLAQFQIEAAIQAIHCDAATFEQTDWKHILALYDQLYELMPTAVVALNRAIAAGEVNGPSASLAVLDRLAPDLDNYHLFHAARGDALRRLGRSVESRESFERAAALAQSDADRRFLVEQARLVVSG